jgi:hypothetical protein
MREKEAVANLQPWLTILDEGIETLLSLHDLILWKRKEGDCTSSPVYFVLTGRSCALAAAIRHLIVSGLEESARPVVRSLAETLNLGLVALVDAKVAEAFLEAVDESAAKEFWKSHVAYGKIRELQRTVGRKAGMSEAETNRWMKRQENLWKAFSGSTHSSVKSAFDASIIPSLRRREYVSMAVLGQVSFYAPHTLGFVYSAIWDYVGISLKLAMSASPPHDLALSPQHWGNGKVKWDSLTVSFMTLQDAILRHWGDVGIFEAQRSKRRARVDANKQPCPLQFTLALGG